MNPTGTLEWVQSEVSSQMVGLTLTNLMQNVIYLVCVAEQAVKKTTPQTSFSIPLEARLGTKKNSQLTHISQLSEFRRFN